MTLNSIFLFDNRVCILMLHYMSCFIVLVKVKMSYAINSLVMIICFFLFQVFRLSAKIQELPISTVCNVHDVNPNFLEIGKRKQQQHLVGVQACKGAYHRKMVWG